MKHVLPTALQFKNDLKLIMVAQYMKGVRNSSYDEDDRSFLDGFFEILTQKRQTYSLDDSSSFPRFPLIDTSNNTVAFDDIELYALYNIAGYIISNIEKNQKTCLECIAATGSKTQQRRTFDTFTHIKCFAEETLFYVNSVTFQFFKNMESIIKRNLETLSTQNNITQFLCKRFRDLPYSLPNCHDLKNKIIKRYCIFRLKTLSTVIRNKSNFASKSMAMHLNIK